jgi:hypothetical protein
VLGNKNDLPEALSANELVAKLELGGLQGRETSVYSMSCRTQVGRGGGCRLPYAFLPSFLFFLFLPYFLFPEVVP